MGILDKEHSHGRYKGGRATGFASLFMKKKKQKPREEDAKEQGPIST
jgi:hypothetical protein